VSPDKEAADRDHDPAFADASSEKPGILPIPAQTHDKPGWTENIYPRQSLICCQPPPALLSVRCDVDHLTGGQSTVTVDQSENLSAANIEVSDLLWRRSTGV
jgi:hypothetical protein